MAQPRRQPSDELGVMIRDARKGLNILQGDLAERLGIVQSEVSAIECGTRLDLPASLVLRMARELRLDPEGLLSAVEKRVLAHQNKSGDDHDPSVDGAPAVVEDDPDSSPTAHRDNRIALSDTHNHNQVRSRESASPRRSSGAPAIHNAPPLSEDDTDTLVDTVTGGAA